MAETPNNEDKDVEKAKNPGDGIGPVSSGQPDASNQREGNRLVTPVNHNADFKNLRSLMMIAGIAGPFSFLFGGVFLSTVALVCAIVAFTVYKRLYNGSKGFEYSSRIKRAIIFSIVISAVALVWNIGWLIMVLPEALQAIQSADFSSLYNGVGAGSDSGTGKTIWD